MAGLDLGSDALEAHVAVQHGHCFKDTLALGQRCSEKVVGVAASCGTRRRVRGPCPAELQLSQTKGSCRSQQT